MMIAKPEVPARSIPELMERNRAVLRQYAHVNPGTSLFHGVDQSLPILLIDLASVLGCLIGVVVGLVASFMREWEWAGVSMATAFVLGLYFKIRMVQGERTHTAHNKEALCCLGALVQANSDLFDPENKEDRWGFMVVDTERKLEQEPERLLRLAISLGAMKSYEEETPTELEELVAEIRAETVLNPKRRPIPKKFIGVEGVIALDVYFKPEILPAGHLDSRLWPVIYCAATDKVPFQPLPKDLWWNERHDELLSEPQYATE